jgi:hypothetical protein
MQNNKISIFERQKINFDALYFSVFETNQLFTTSFSSVSVLNPCKSFFQSLCKNKKTKTDSKLSTLHLG